MRIGALAVLVFCFAPLHLGAQHTAKEASQLYAEHGWFDLRASIANDGASLFYRAAVETAFHQDRGAEADLKRFIASHPDATMLLQARELLIGMDFRSARYRDALREAHLILQANPSAQDIANFLPALEFLSGFNRQTVVSKEDSVSPVVILDQNLVVPVTIGKNNGNYILDNGFSLSGMSESEAERLKLVVRDVPTQIDTMSGAQVKIRIAVVPELILGRTRLRNVAFYVLPDNQPPFNQLESGKQGILGLPVLLALGHFSWQPKALTLRIFSSTAKSPDVPANLAFDGTSVFTQMKFRGQQLDVSLDTGAQNTVLYPSFAKRFPDIKSLGAAEAHRLTGAGGSTSIGSLSIPSVDFEIANRRVTLAPATVILRENNSTAGWFNGNLGMDLLNQADSIDVNFSKMTLVLK
jgi:predicted aspartyl protease